MKKRIIICCSYYPPNFIGGAELIAHYHAKVLQKLGHEVIIFSGEIGNQTRYSTRKDIFDGITVYRICLTHKDYDYNYVNYSHKAIEKVFIKLIKKFKPNILHFHNMTGLSLGMIHIAKRNNTKTILTLHDFWGLCYRNTIIKDKKICKKFNKCQECMVFINDGDDKNIPIIMRKDYIDIEIKDIDHFISPSKYLAKKYIDAGYPKKKFNVIWNGIDVNKYCNIVKVKSKKRVRFTFIGNIAEHKGVKVLLNALKFIDNKYSIKVNIVGSGEKVNECKRLLKGTGKENLVKYWGRVQNTEIDKVYSNTDVLVMPSIWPENQPVTITEAMAAKIPVIGSDIGGIPELIDHNKTGYLFEPGNSKELARRMLNFILNPKKIKKYGENGYKKIADKTFEGQVDKIIKIYNKKAIKNKKGKSSLVVCVGKRMNIENNNINSFIKGSKIMNKYYFVMSDWLEKDQKEKAKLFWVVDRNNWFSDILFALKNKIPLLIPESNRILKMLCNVAHCGFYYRDLKEAEGRIRNIIKAEK